MRKLIKNLNKSGGSRIEVTVLTPAEHGYFAVTYSAYVRNRDVAGGCNPELICKTFPELASVVALHLSDAQGVPMHCVANGWFWLAKAAGIPQPYGPEQSVEECRRILSEHLRLSVGETSDMINTTRTIADQESVDAAKANFVQWVEDLKPRWLVEARAAQATYG